jgi:hypothetical protein
MQQDELRGNPYITVIHTVAMANVSSQDEVFFSIAETNFLILLLFDEAQCHGMTAQ